MNPCKNTLGVAGISLLEVSAALAIAALAFSVSFPALKVDSILKRRTEKAVAAELDMNFIEDLLTSAVHQAGRFCFYRPSFLVSQFCASNILNIPPGLTGIGFAIPVPTLALHASGASRSSGNSRTLCSHRPWNSSLDPVPLAKVENWLAVSADGTTVAAGRFSRPSSGRSACSGETEYRTTLIPNDLLLNLLYPVRIRSYDRAILQHSAAYFGIREAFIVAADGNGILRRRSLTTNENAPIAADIAAISAKIETEQLLTLSIEPRIGRTRRFSIALPRQCQSYEVLG